MNKFEKNLMDENYKKGILRMLKGNERKFVGIISNLQELCYERRDLEDVTDLEFVNDDLDIDELWRLDSDVMLDIFDIQNRNERREEASKQIIKLFDILGIKFENNKKYAS